VYIWLRDLYAVAYLHPLSSILSMISIDSFVIAVGLLYRTQIAAVNIVEGPSSPVTEA
jgi:hypothetical protein